MLTEHHHAIIDEALDKMLVDPADLIVFDGTEEANARDLIFGERWQYVIDMRLSLPDGSSIASMPGLREGVAATDEDLREAVEEGVWAIKRMLSQRNYADRTVDPQAELVTALAFTPRYAAEHEVWLQDITHHAGMTGKDDQATHGTDGPR